MLYYSVTMKHKRKGITMEHLTKEEVLKIFKEEGSYLSDPKDYRPGMIIDETPKVIRDSILNDDNDDVERTLEGLKELDEYESKHVKGARETAKRLIRFRESNKFVTEIENEWNPIVYSIADLVVNSDPMSIEDVNKVVNKLNEFVNKTNTKIWALYAERNSNKENNHGK